MRLLLAVVLLGGLLAGGEGGRRGSFRQVLWYHFPKSGGTTMRNLLYAYCRHEGFNMTSQYSHSASDDCAKIPFSCTRGSKMYFTYGHSIADFNNFSNEDILHIFMIRDPLSWLLSRHQHYRRKNPHSRLTLVQASQLFGDKYFNFLDNHTMSLCTDWFRRIVSEENKFSIDGTNKGGERIDFPPQEGVTGTSTHISQILESLHNHYLKLSNTIVLVTDYYHESLAYLSYFFDTPHFLSASKILFSDNDGLSPSHRIPFVDSRRRTDQDTVNVASQYLTLDLLNDFVSRNRADRAESLQPIEGTVDDMKTLMRILELHFALYHAVLAKFFQQITPTQLRLSDDEKMKRPIHSRMKHFPTPSPTTTPEVILHTMSPTAIPSRRKEVVDNWSSDKKRTRYPIIGEGAASSNRRKKVSGKLQQRGFGKLIARGDLIPLQDKRSFDGRHEVQW